MSSGRDAWNIQFLSFNGASFFAENDGAVFTFKQGNTNYWVVVAVDQRTEQRLRENLVGNVVSLRVDKNELVEIEGNPGFWIGKLFPGLSGGGQANLIQIFKWK